MAKPPSFQFYPADYIRDTRALSLEAKGAWADILCHGFFNDPQGRISQDLDAWARMFGCSVDTAKTVLDLIKKLRVGDVVTDRNGDVTVTNRRMHRDWQEREATKIRVKRFRDKNKEGESPPELRNGNGDVTLHSSSSSSISTSDLKRLIDACVREHPSGDARLIEIAVLETIMRRKGSANEGRPIRSTKYFDEEITKILTKSGGLSSDAVGTLLERRREQANRETAGI